MISSNKNIYRKIMKALITGITGQDGSYLTEILLEKGYEVHGIIRRSSSFNTARIDHLYADSDLQGKRLFLHYGDLVDASNLNRLLEKIAPQEIYNLAAQSHVKVSFELPDYTAQVDALGTLRFLDAIREVSLERETRFYQASTSELYGKVQEIPQSEKTPFYPRSPYGVAKLYGYWIIVNYREAYNLYACNGILFNHESPRRGETFVTRKVTRAASRILLGLQDVLVLGNMDAKRDWGYAPEYTEAMWKILQLDKPDDFVIATGETHTVREFVEKTFAYLGVTLAWEGKEENEVAKVETIKFPEHLANTEAMLEFSKKYNPNGKTIKQGDVVVKISPQYYRPTEVDILIGDPTKAKETFGWNPQTTFEELVRVMTDADFKKVLNKGY